MMISNVLFTGAEIRRVIEKSDLSHNAKCQIWSYFIDYAINDKRLSLSITSVDSIEGRDAGDEHPSLFV